MSVVRHFPRTRALAALASLVLVCFGCSIDDRQPFVGDANAPDVAEWGAADTSGSSNASGANGLGPSGGFSGGSPGSGGSSSDATSGEVGFPIDANSGSGVGDATGAGGSSGGMSGGPGTTDGSAMGGSTGAGGITYCLPDVEAVDVTCTGPSVNHWANWVVSERQSYSVTSTDLVSDPTTGLTWQRKVATRSGSSCTGPGLFTWNEAICHCNSLSLPGATSGWRLPSRSELTSILAFRTGNPMIDTVAFPDTPGEVFWTSSLDAGGAWMIAFNSGGISVNGDTSQTYLVRCVRGGLAAPATRYSLGTGALAGTVLDNATRLRWQTASIGPATADLLAQDCSASSLGQLTWRLPSIEELLTIVDETTSNPAFDTSIFSGGPDDYVSSSAFDSTFIEAVSFWWGQSGLMGATTNAYARCVTGG
jgi:hypothetical protein